MTRKRAASAQEQIRQHVIAGSVVVAVLTIGVGGWAATAGVSSALIAPGQIVVDSNVKKVQHPTGGIVGEVRVRDGDRVKAGDIVVRLDETVTRANLAVVTKGLNELTARKARLEAERDGADAIRFPAELTNRAQAPVVAAVMTSERKLFELRQTARTGQKAQLRQRILQLDEEISGLSAQRDAKAKEIALIDRELKGVRELFQKNLVQMNRLTQLEREATRLEGERGQFVAATAQAKGKISELELQIIQIDQELSSEVARELREVDGKIGEFVERKVTAEDQLKRIDIRAPQDGTVFQSTVHTVGGVIPAGDAIMLIVPAADNLTVEAKVNPQDIDQLKVGQNALLRFTSFNQRTTPEINGTVTRISADISTDQRTGLSYYTVRIGLPPQEVARLGDVKLVPGMPVEAFVQTGERTVLSYLMKPFYDQLTRAFREK
ncbi:MAG: HlyD family type I secretion periplasmic adaptor subunit [Pseudorhodoplanes sp.]|jgi:HlyD family secretion protein|nr:HlyD family type I secretion periplasmic adaptor subunit [Pseudorhodoplanes sp.]